MSAVEVVGVAKSYGAVVALEDVSFSVAPGEILGLLGPNGAGKTTLVRILATLLHPDRGEAFVDGANVVTEGAAVRHRIGLAGQLAALDGMLTGAENLEIVGRLYGLSGERARERAAELLERFDLTDAAERPVQTYSGGMRRRLDLGATLIGDPSVLLLDEPTAGLDPKSRAELWDLVGAVAAAGTAILLTSQYLEELDRLASRIVVLDEGRVIAEGTASALKGRVGGQVLEARFGDAIDLDAAAVALAGSGVAAAQRDEVLRRVTVPSDGTTAALVDAAHRLDGAGVAPLELGYRMPTLDDVFFAFTGASGAGADEPKAASATPPAAPTRRAHHGQPARGRTLADIVTMTWRHLLLLRRTPQLLFFATVQPVLFVLGLSAVFGPLVERILGQDYIDYLVPGVVVMNLVLAAGSTGIGLAADMDAGIVDRFRSLPMSRIAVLAGRTTSDLVRNVLSMFVILLAGLALGFRPIGSALETIGAVVVALVFAYAWTWLFAAIGLAVKDPQTAQFAGFAPVLPLVFLSGSWVPVETMAPAIRGFATHQPVNVTVDAVRSLFGGAADGSAIIQSLAWSTAFLVIFSLLAVGLYQRAR